MKRYDFASDNTAGMAPEALDALVAANAGVCASYGNDEHTARAVAALRALFERDCEIFFVFTGTAANSLALAQLCRSHHAVICHEVAHIETDECGAPGFFNAGMKLLLAPGDNAKLTPAEVAQLARSRDDVHAPKARALSLTLPTELGTVYTLDELSALRDVARKHRLFVHLDGARFANAVAHLGCSPRAIIEASGADILCFGGTKGGFGLGEAVLFFDKKLAAEFDYRCKQAGQLASKTRVVSAPWAAMLANDNWRRHAQIANDGAQALAQIFRDNNIEPLHPVEANAVFVRLAPEIAQKLTRRGWQFYDFNGAARWMCSWNTSAESLSDLRRDVEAITREGAPQLCVA